MYIFGNTDKEKNYAYPCQCNIVVCNIHHFAGKPQNLRTMYVVQKTFLGEPGKFISTYNILFLFCKFICSFSLFFLKKQCRM